MWHGLFTIVRKEGPMALMKGFGPVALLTAPAHGVYFGVYEGIKELIPRRGAWGRLSESSVHLTAGFAANTVGAVLWTPMDVIKQRQQARVGKGPYPGPLAALAQVYKEDGLRRGLMRGYWSGLATYGPFSAIYFVVYERYKLLLRQHLQRELHTGNFSVGGLIAGSVAAVLTAPIDLVKTRLQVADGAEGSVKLVRRILREEGLRAFSRGIGARVCWVAPGCAITIALYEHFKVDPPPLSRCYTHPPCPCPYHAAVASGFQRQRLHAPRLTRATRRQVVFAPLPSAKVGLADGKRRGLESFADAAYPDASSHAPPDAPPASACDTALA